MKQEIISALVDGELSPPEVHQVMENMQNNEAELIARYHLIGDILRNPQHGNFSLHLSSVIMARIQDVDTAETEHEYTNSTASIIA